MTDRFLVLRDASFLTRSIAQHDLRQGVHALEPHEMVAERERLLDAVWSHDTEIDSRTVDVHVRRLRKALNDGGLPDVIRTVRSAGYSLDADD